MAPITADASLGSLTKRDTEVPLPRAMRMKNKTPAAVQITAAHILREARYGRQIRPPKQKMTDVHELADHRLKKEPSSDDLGEATKKALRKVQRKRPLPTDDGSSTVHHQEYIDNIFPDEAALAPNLKILEAAYKWKKLKTDDKESKTITDLNIERLPVVNAFPRLEISATMPKSDVGKVTNIFCGDVEFVPPLTLHVFCGLFS